MKMSITRIEISEKVAPRCSKYLFLIEKTVVPSLHSFQSDPFSVRRWGILVCIITFC